MHFHHAADIWTDFPELVPGVLAVGGITPDADVVARLAPWHAIADARLEAAEVGAQPEIQAWRRAFSRMGLKPTQYRSASEALLRRYAKDGALPRIHPLIDICNAVSLAFATPVAVFDVSGIEGGLVVRRATGDETSQTFSGDVERPDPGEVIFADSAGRVHARRWCNRQTGFSAIRESTSDILIVTEAMHPGAADDMPRLVAALAGELSAIWSVTPESAILSAGSPVFAT